MSEKDYKEIEQSIKNMTRGELEELAKVTLIARTKNKLRNRKYYHKNKEGEKGASNGEN